MVAVRDHQYQFEWCIAMIHGSTLCGADKSNRCLQLKIDRASSLGRQDEVVSQNYHDA
jgi:hypothetical protein